jgi:hypothetical protein
MPRYTPASLGYRRLLLAPPPSQESLAQREHALVLSVDEKPQIQPLAHWFGRRNSLD